VTNADQLRWWQLWLALAKHFRMEYAEPQPMSLAEPMPQHADIWQSLAARHGLLETPFAELVGWGVGDSLFRHEADAITSTVQIRQAGFADCLDTETRLLEWFDQLVQQEVIPPITGPRSCPASPWARVTASRTDASW
jgi:hypothetical protein